MPKQPLGSFAFVLHSHIPYVLTHGRWPHGSNWLLEVTAETYIPLLNALNDLVDEGYNPKVTIGLTPVLVEQLEDESFKYEFAAYARMRARSAVQNRREFAGREDTRLIQLADFWHKYYSDILHSFNKRYNRSVVGAFRKLQDAGHIEVMTSSATHGYSPLLSQDISIQAQVKQGVQTYKRHFGRSPMGYWLPECAYRPAYRWAPPLQPKGQTIEPYFRKGIEEFLRENELKYFVIESHLLQGGETRGVYIDRFGALQKLWKQYQKEDPQVSNIKSPYMPYVVSSSEQNEDPVFVFVRDQTTGSQVWSRSLGYPGDEWYLEFHKMHSPGRHRYWRVSGSEVDLGDKKIYEPHRADEITGNQTAHFMEVARGVLRENYAQTGKPGVICAAYDTELYGHWWFEGPRWLYRVLKAMHDDPEIELVTCSEYLEKNDTTASIALPEGSWGEGGFHYIWLNENTDWTWPNIYEAELEIQELAKEYGDNVDVQPILKQAVREMFLLQSSDWQFCISTFSSKEYAEMRFLDHYNNFKKLAEIIRKKASGEEISEADWNVYKICEERNNLFPDVNPKWFAKLER